MTISMKELLYLIQRIEENNIISISIRNFIANFYKKNGYPSSLEGHYAPICASLKKDKKRLLECIKYEKLKSEYLFSNPKPFFDICPFGVLDYVAHLDTNNPYIILYITHNNKFPRKNKKNYKLEICTDLNEIIEDNYLEQIPIVQNLIHSIISFDYKSFFAVHKGPAHVMVFEAKKKIIHSYQKNISLHSIAKELKISKSLLARYYKKIFQQTIHEDINFYRISLSKRYLELKYSVIETAHEVGYNDSKYFSRVFKNLTGLSPGEWKKANDENIE